MIILSITTSALVIKQSTKEIRVAQVPSSGPWEGELRNMWKPTQQPGLWFHGGNLHQSRHYSIYLSLQLKARMEGMLTEVYSLQEVHHLG